MKHISYFFKKMLRLPKKQDCLQLSHHWFKWNESNTFYEKQNFENFILTFWFFLVLPEKPILDLGWQNFCFGAPIEIKIIFSKSWCIFLTFKKVSKSPNQNWDRRNLPKIHFVLRGNTSRKSKFSVVLVMFIGVSFLLIWPEICWFLSKSTENWTQ